jgi:hypothetical protein
MKNASWVLFVEVPIVKNLYNVFRLCCVSLSPATKVKDFTLNAVAIPAQHGANNASLVVMV